MTITVRFAMALLLVVAVACTPEVRLGGAQIAYADAQHPLKDTAVLSAIAEETNGLGQISSVDGKPTNCWRAGCPSCVRVLPGTHFFTIRYTIPGLGFKHQGETTVTVESMKPERIYAARYEIIGDKFRVSIVDLGNRPHFRTELGLRGVNVTCVEPIGFD